MSQEQVFAEIFNYNLVSIHSHTLLYNTQHWIWGMEFILMYHMQLYMAVVSVGMSHVADRNNVIQSTTTSSSLFWDVLRCVLHHSIHALHSHPS